MRTGGTEGIVGTGADAEDAEDEVDEEQHDCGSAGDVVGRVVAKAGVALPLPDDDRRFALFGVLLLLPRRCVVVMVVEVAVGTVLLWTTSLSPLLLLQSSKCLMKGIGFPISMYTCLLIVWQG